MLSNIRLFILFYFRRDHVNCDECRYCCTVLFCAYTDENGGVINLDIMGPILKIPYLEKSEYTLELSSNFDF